MEAEYHNQIEHFPAGKTYEKVEIDSGTINKHDNFVWENVKPNSHTKSIYVGYITNIFERDEPELATSAPLGRLQIDESMRAIAGPDINRNIDNSSMKFIERFIDSNYDKYMKIHWKVSGGIEVTGE